MKKTLILVLALVLLISLSTEAFAGIESITLSNNQPGADTEYRINYRVDGSDLQQSSDDFITLFFYTPGEFPPTIAPENILINSKPAIKIKTYKTQNRVDVFVPANIEANQLVDILVKPEAGIKNPYSPGSYKLGISSSKISSVSQISYIILPGSITSLAAEVNPKSTGMAAKYNISFKISSTGRLKGGTDNISITLPQEITFPYKINEYSVTVNGIALDRGFLRIAGNTLTLTVPSDVTIEPEGQVTVIIETAAKIVNPQKPGEYKIQVSTSRDTTGVLSQSYVIGESAIADLVVKVEPNTAYTEALYDINFKTGPHGILQGGKDTITITFPGGVKIPFSIMRNSIEVQGEPVDTGSVDIDDQTISFTLPSTASVGPDSPVHIKIKQEAGIQNPSKTGAKKIKVSTSSDRTKADSNSYRIIAGKTITLTIDSIMAYIDGRGEVLDTPATIMNGRTLVPIRFISESYGADIQWNNPTKEVTINLDGKHIVLSIASRIALVDDRRVSLDTAPITLNGRTMVPVRFIAENFGSEVTWDDKTSTITLKQ